MIVGVCTNPATEKQHININAICHLGLVSKTDNGSTIALRPSRLIQLVNISLHPRAKTEENLQKNIQDFHDLALDKTSQFVRYK